MAEFIDALLELNREAEEAHGLFEDLNARAKGAKARWEGLVRDIQARLKKYDEEGRSDRLPFGDDITVKVAPDSQPGDIIDAEWEHAPQPQLTGAEPWRKVLIDRLGELGCSEKTVQCLIDDGINTIGDLASRNKEHNNLTQITGIGEAKAAEIENAMDAFWTEWNKSGGDLVTSKPGTWINDEISDDKPKRSKKKKAKDESEAA